MRRPYYVAAWTDSWCMVGCDHQHTTVTSAAACNTGPGSYVVAVQRGKYRELTAVEEAEFQCARYGGTVQAKEAVLRLMLSVQRSF